MAVPVALIRQLCYPSGYRLPKLTRLEYKWKPAEAAKPYSVALARVNPTPMQGNLPNDEYRFFVGKYEKTWMASTCRWCGSLFHNVDGRKRHKDAKCKEKLTRLYARILPNKRCVACNAVTTREYWGLPFCSVVCENTWRFTEPPVFRSYLDREKKQLEAERLFREANAKVD